MDRHIPQSFGETLIHGQKDVTTAGTAEILLTATESLWLHIRAKEDNSANIYVGDSDVDSANGFILTTTNPDVKMYFDHKSDNLYIDSGSSGDGVSYIGYV